MDRLKNLGLVFTSPASLGSSIDERPAWVIPFALVLLVVFVASASTFYYRMDYERASYQKILRDRVQEDDLESMFAKTPTKRVIAGVAAVAVTAVVMLIASAILNGAASVAGGRIGFKKMFALYVHTSLIGSVGNLVMSGLVVAKGDVDVRMSLAAFARTVSLSSPLGTFLNMFDVFTLWMLTALTISYSVLGHISVKRSAVIVFGLWGVLVAIVVGLTYLRLMATGMM